MEVCAPNQESEGCHVLWIILVPELKAERMHFFFGVYFYIGNASTWDKNIYVNALSCQVHLKEYDVVILPLGGCYGLNCAPIHILHANSQYFRM